MLAALLTDFGLDDVYVGVMKAVLLGRCPLARVVDLTHGIRRQDMFYFGRRLAYLSCACIFATGLIGTSLFTAVPMTALLLLLTGWFAVREVRFAPSLSAPVAPGLVAPPAVTYGRAT